MFPKGWASVSWPSNGLLCLPSHRICRDYNTSEPANPHEGLPSNQRRFRFVLSFSMWVPSLPSFYLPILKLPVNESFVTVFQIMQYQVGSSFHQHVVPTTAAASSWTAFGSSPLQIAKGTPNSIKVMKAEAGISRNGIPSRAISLFQPL